LGKSEQSLWREEGTFQTTPKSKSMIAIRTYVKATKEVGETNAAKGKDIHIKERNEKLSSNREPHSKTQP